MRKTEGKRGVEINRARGGERVGTGDPNERRRAGKERKRGSRAEWKRDGSIYRLLSSDASGITFVRFAGVDDVVAHGVGVISTREGTYLPITVLSSLLPSCARTYARIYSTLFPAPFIGPFSVRFIYFVVYIPSISVSRCWLSPVSLVAVHRFAVSVLLPL